MRNIGISEWSAMLAEVVTAIGSEARPCMVALDSRSRLVIEYDRPHHSVLSLSIELRYIRDYALSPSLLVGSSAGLPCDVEGAQASVDQMQHVLSVGRRVFSIVSGVLVHSDDRVPCDSCSGTGTTRGRACVRCNGTGKRIVEVRA